MSQRHIKSVITLATIFASATCFAGNGVGNGGIAYVCRDATKKITRAELLDLWEPLTYKIERSNESIDTQIDRAAERIALRFPALRKKFTDSIHKMRELVLMTDRTLELTDDALPNFKPESGCAWEQVARYTWVNDIGAMKILINREIFESPLFADTDKAALYVHETVYAGYTQMLEFLAASQAAGHSINPQISNLPKTSQITRQIVQAAFWRMNAVSEREDLMSHLRWIIPKITGERPADYCYIANVPPITLIQSPRSSMSFAYIPLNSGTCKFKSTHQDGRTSEQSIVLQTNKGLSDKVAEINRLMNNLKWRRYEKLMREVNDQLIKSRTVLSVELGQFTEGELVLVEWNCDNGAVTTISSNDSGVITALNMPYELPTTLNNAIYSSLHRMKTPTSGVFFVQVGK